MALVHSEQRREVATPAESKVVPALVDEGLTSGSNVLGRTILGLALALAACGGRGILVSAQENS